MKKHPSQLVFWGVGVALVCAAGAVVAAYSGPGLTPTMASATFATNVVAGMSWDAIKRLWGVVVDSARRPVNDNHVILRELRGAQLAALADLRRRFDRDRITDPDAQRSDRSALFSEWLGQFLHVEETRIAKLTLANLPEPSEAEAAACRAALLARAPDDFNASLSARHGSGPALRCFRLPAEAAMLAELRAAVHEEIPTSFENLLIGSPDGTDGWFALFIRHAAKRLDNNPEFEREWQLAQTAVIRVLADQTHTAVAEFAAGLAAQTATLKAYGTQLDAIAGDVAAARALAQSMYARLDDTRGWLYFEADFKAENWWRFHAFNPRIPFLGREHELAKLYGFLQDPRAFAWWVATGPGGAGKTRLALELCSRAHLNGWTVGFLTRDFKLPTTPWQPRRPTLIVVDYAAQQLKSVRELAMKLAYQGTPDQPVVRMLLLERQVDFAFWDRFFDRHGSTAGTLTARQYHDEALQLPEMSAEELWDIVRGCPWRTDGKTLEAVGMEREVFFGHLSRIDSQNRALVAMLLADAAAETPERIAFTSLDDVLKGLVATARKHHWPQELAAADNPVGKAIPADVLIAAATMAGHVDGDLLDKIKAQLGREIEPTTLHDCARAIGSAIYRDTARLDGLQPDLIGEFFALEVITGAPAPFPWLPELAWRADESRMAAFVTRARQNFPGEHHRAALERLSTVVPGVTESWWLDVGLQLEEAAAAALPLMIGTARDRLIAAAVADLGAAGAFARLCWFASAQDNSVVRWALKDELVRELLSLPGMTRANPAVREGLAACLLNTLTHARAENALDRRDALLDELRALATAHPADAAVREKLAMGLFNTLNDARAENALERRDWLLNEFRALATAYPADAAVREWLAKGLFNTLAYGSAENALERRDSLLDELRALATAYPADAAVREWLVKGIIVTDSDRANDGAGNDGAYVRLAAFIEQLDTWARQYPDDPFLAKLIQVISSDPRRHRLRL